MIKTSLVSRLHSAFQRKVFNSSLTSGSSTPVPEPVHHNGQPVTPIPEDLPLAHQALMFAVTSPDPWIHEAALEALGAAGVIVVTGDEDPQQQ